MKLQHSLSPLTPTPHSLSLYLKILKSKSPNPKSPKPKSQIKALSTTTASDSSLSIQYQTLESLEWVPLCNQLTRFTTTSMARSATLSGDIPVGDTVSESESLFDQTASALAFMEAGGGGRRLDLSGVEDVSGVVEDAVVGRLLSVGEICGVMRTLREARFVFRSLMDFGDCSALIELLDGCDFRTELEQKIGFCIDCNLSVVLDRASEDLEIIRAERKQNMEKLDTLLREISARIFQAGVIDKPLVTRRRSRLCVGVRTSYKHLVPGGVVLDVSGSGATYFMEPAEAVELNNLEVVLSNSEKEEEIAILSLLTNEIAESEKDIKHMLDCILAVDLAFARASFARWINGVRPILTYETCGVDESVLVDIEGIRHPLLLGSSQKRFSNVLEPNLENLVKFHGGNGAADAQSLSNDSLDFPVPINIKVGCGRRVVVISGPNTGGKTASMKTLGVASLMSKAGLYLPAKSTPRLPWFDLVLADIGDHQSLEHNLSTFSGHISRVCKILESATKRSLVLIDEICSGTDPSEGVALSTSILQYLKDRVNLVVVTTHYADLSLLRDTDPQFENAAMEFSIETLQPTYQVLWGSTGVSNALSIAQSIGFDRNVINCAKEWVEKLTPEKQQERKGLLYQSLMEERSRLEAHAMEAESLHREIMELYNEIQYEAEDLNKRESALVATITQKVQDELSAAKSQIETVVHDLDMQLKKAGLDQYNQLIRKSESAIAAIIEAHSPRELSHPSEADTSPYTPQNGEQVNVKGLGGKLATVVEVPSDDDDTILVQYGKIRVWVKKTDIKPSRRSNAMNLAPQVKKQGKQDHSKVTNKPEEVAYSPRVQTSKNTVDLRGMRVEEATLHLTTAISAQESKSIIFVVHGMGTGAVKQRALEILGMHPRVAKYEPESPMNFGCTVAYIK